MRPDGTSVLALLLSSLLLAVRAHAISASGATVSGTTLLCEASGPVCGGRCPSGGACGTGAGGCECRFGLPSLQDLAAMTGRVVGAAVKSIPLANDPLYAGTVAREYGSVSTDFELIWSYVHRVQGAYDFAAADSIVAFAEAHGMRVQGTPVVWYGVLPSYLDALSASALAAELEEHVRTVVGRYRGRIGSWVIVNEPVDELGEALRDNVFLSRVGPDYIADAFRWAHEADPEARLFLNEVLADGLNAKSDYLYGLARSLLAAGVPLHGVGLQMHMGGFFGPLPSAVRENIQRFVDLGLAVNITELDVQTIGLGPDEATRLTVQGTIYRDVVAACVAVPGCDTITTWGFTDRYSWIDQFFGPGQLPLPFDVDYVPKPAYHGMVDALVMPPESSTSVIP